MTSLDGDLRPPLVDEAAEGLAELEAMLLQLEKAPDDREAVARISGIVGSLETCGARLRFTEMVRFAHAIECLLDQLRRGVRPVTPLVVDALLASVDVLRGLVTRIVVDPEATEEPDENAERVRGIIDSLREEPRELPKRPRPSSRAFPDARSASLRHVS
jgi:two-component system chemotaxis sensor kinase CheA